jgi:hypothetical protein
MSSVVGLPIVLRIFFYTFKHHIIYLSKYLVLSLNASSCYHSLSL